MTSAHRKRRCSRVELYLVRHAEAGERDPARWPDDAARPLTEEGEQKFRRGCRGLRRIVPDVELVLSSGATRAWRTAEILHEEAGWPSPERSSELGSASSTREIWNAVRKRQVSSVALVGHEPHMSELVSYLLSGNHDVARPEFKKGGVACLRLPDEKVAGTAALRWLLTPKILQALQAETA